MAECGGGTQRARMWRGANPLFSISSRGGKLGQADRARLHAGLRLVANPACKLRAFGFLKHRAGAIKKPLQCNGFLCLARLAGFEPTTPWFVARYSNPTELQPLKSEIVAEKKWLFEKFFFFSANTLIFLRAV